MNKTAIEWCDYTINPVKGLCPVACSYCYARAMYKRFKWNPRIREEAKVYNELKKMPAGGRVFVGSTMELFGEWVNKQWLDNILTAVKQYPELTFIFLTKIPENLPRQFPDNCWVGASAHNYSSFRSRCDSLEHIKAKKFISFEPLFEVEYSAPNLQFWMVQAGIKWVIIGQQTPPNKNARPKLTDVKEIVTAADNVGVSVFLKDNLQELFIREAIKTSPVPEFIIPEWAGVNMGYAKRNLRQELPE